MYRFAVCHVLARTDGKKEEIKDDYLPPDSGLKWEINHAQYGTEFNAY